MESNRLTLIVTTIQRPEAARRFLDSVRRWFPELPIILSEQADEHQLVEFCAERAIQHLPLEFDSGLGRARNAMVDRVETDFFILTDDDYLFREPPDFNFCTRFLDAHREFVCVVGYLCDQFPSGDGYAHRHWDRIKNLCLDRTSGALVIIPRTFMPPPDIVFEGEELLRCDLGPNWGVFRRSFFVDNDIRWDERFKIGAGEHFDFFLQLKVHPTRVGVAFWPKLQCDHLRGTAASYAQLRRRMDWHDGFHTKWGLQFRYEVCEATNLEVFGNNLPGLERWQTPLSPPAEELRQRIAALQERLARMEWASTQN